MKKNILLITAMAISNLINAQIPEGYEVAQWKDFRQAAITYSFDDGTPNQIPAAVPTLEKYGYRGTFNLVTDWVKDWNGWKKISDNGHEIASHTVSHPYLDKLTAEQQTVELAKSKEIIEQNVGKECVTMVYPYCVRGNDSIVADYYISARICCESFSSPSPQNMFAIASRLVGTESQYLKNTYDFNMWAKLAVKENGWCVFLIHGIDNDGGYSPIKSIDLDSHLKFVQENEPTFWVGTFAEVSKYIIERNSLKISEKQQGEETEISVEVTAESKVTKLDYPVTIKRRLPNGKGAIVTHNGKVIDSKLDDGCIIFDVVPGNTYLLVYDEGRMLLWTIFVVVGAILLILSAMRKRIGA